MSQDENDNPHGVEAGNIYEDLDVGRPLRHLKVMEVKGKFAHVLNTKTERMSKISLTRLSPRSGNSHGYRLISSATSEELPTIEISSNAQPAFNEFGQ